MASPFDFFRKRQAGMMVVMVILSMLLFTLDALFMQQGANFWLLGLLVGGAVFGVAGMSNGKWLSWGLGGAAMGALLGFILPSFVVSPGAVATKIGVIDTDQFNDFQEQRRIANQFVAMAAEESFGQGASRFAPMFGFNQRGRDDLLFGRLMEEEADSLGIVVTNDMVNDYLKTITDQKLTKESFAKIRTSMTYQNKPLDEPTLYDIFRRQIKARMAHQALLPIGSVSPPPPDVYWEYFRRLNVHQQINLTELDVDAFLEQVAEPSPGEVEEAFAAAKQKIPNQDAPGSLGFRLPGRARMAWLEVDYDTIEKSVAAVTDEEVEAFYNENREERYQIPVLSDEVEKDDDDEASGNAVDEPGDGNVDDDSDVDAEDADEDDADEAENNAETDGDEDDEFADDDASDDDVSDTDTTDEESPDTDEEELNNNDPLIIPKESDEADDQQSDSPINYEYRELDDDLKSEIRDELLQRRTRETIAEKMTSAENMMAALATRRSARLTEIVDSDTDKYGQLFGPDGEEVAAELRAEMAKFTPQLLKEMSTFADENGLTFVETPFLTYDEFRNADDYPLGTATEPGQQGFNPRGSADAARTIYSSFSIDATNNDTQLFLQRRAVSQPETEEGAEIHFAYWAVDFSEPHVPTLDEPGVREQVKLALKRQKARDILKKRAEELVTQVRDGLSKQGDDKVTMAVTLESETITGNSESATLQVRASLPFSWLRTSQASPMNFQQRPQVEVSRIRFSDGRPPLDDLGTDFFEAIFEEMQDEDVRLVPNYDRSRYYIVHVTNRFPTPEEGTKGLLERFGREGQLSFLNSPITDMMRNDLISPSLAQWEAAMWRKYDVVPGGAVE